MGEVCLSPVEHFLREQVAEIWMHGYSHMYMYV